MCVQWKRGLGIEMMVSHHYSRLRASLLRYISPLTVDMVLNRTLAAVETTPQQLRSEQLADVVEAAMMSLRMFVAEESLPELMLELADLIEEVPAAEMSSAYGT